MNKIEENNRVTLSGEITKDFTFSHSVFGEDFYISEVKSPRLGSGSDTIPVMVSNRLLDMSLNYVGQLVSIEGQFRSYNKDGRVYLSVFAKEVWIIGLVVPSHESNSVQLYGHVCKEPVYRKTPLGREITDLHLAVNRSYGKSDYIPCICWGRNARFAGSLNVGDAVEIVGRIQSREYTKKIDEKNTVIRTAYEVSVATMGVCSDEEKDNRCTD